MILKHTTACGIMLLLGVTLGLPQATAALTLKEYMNEVQGQNSGYQGTSIQSEGAALKAREADLYFTPQLFAEARIGYDEKQASPPVMVYNRLATDNYKVGLSQQFNFGLQSKLYYELNKTNFAGANFGPNVMTEYWDASPKLELSMPLWGGGFGRSARATQEITRQQNAVDQYSSGAQANNYLVGAEAVYWRLSAWQEVVRIQERALTAAQNIYSYVARKQGMNLGEKADVIQAQALLESRTLELQVAKNEAQEALRSFNKFRNQEPYAPVDQLELVDFKSLENIAVPQNRPGDRLDVKATEAQLSAAKANAQITLERNRPTLDVYGTYALNARNAELNEALQKSGGSDRDTAFMGMRFNVPLNFSATSDTRSGALKAERAAELNHQYARYAQEMDWTTLTRTLMDARDNLKLLGRIEEVQKSKLENERARLRQGRTTTYQVLLFEQDYTQAAVTRVKSAANILGLQSQLKLYETQYSPEGGK